MNKYPSKEVNCECGNKVTIDKEFEWCEKCCEKVFYDGKGRRAHKMNVIYAYAIGGGVIFLALYLFIELIIVPLTP